MKLREQRGFTIIELVVVIVVIGILAAVALPRFLSLQDRAHDAVVEGTQAALASGVIMAQAVWLAEGRDAALDNILDKTILVCRDSTTLPPEASSTCVDNKEVSLDSNAKGFPVSHTVNDPITGNTIENEIPQIANPEAKGDGEDACVEIFEFLLSESSVKTAGFTEMDAAIVSGSSEGADVDFTYQALPPTTDNECVWEYLPDIADNQGDNRRKIVYDAENGRVTVDFLSSSGSTSL